MSATGGGILPLGESPFNYPLHSYSAARFLHYRQQLLYVLDLAPATVLEVGPGDHTVTDFLRRKGVLVRTLDSDAALHPDHVGDIRRALPIAERFDVVLASEVLEHLDFKWFDTAVGNLAAAVRPGGHLVLSLPYTTLRFFPPDAKYGRLVSVEGRLSTGIPLYRVQALITVVRAICKLAQGAHWREALRPFRVGPFPDDRVDVHHWDLGVAPTTRPAVRERLRRRFARVREHVHVDTNCVFFVITV